MACCFTGGGAMSNKIIPFLVDYIVHNRYIGPKIKNISNIRKYFARYWWSIVKQLQQETAKDGEANCKAATKFEKIDWEQAYTQWLTHDTVWPWHLNRKSQGHKSSNKIWEDPLRTNLNAKVYLHLLHCKNIKWPWTGKFKVRVT